MNTIGTLTLCKKEIWRFLKVWNQTIVAPVITTLLFLAILTLALGGGERIVEGLRFDQFIAPGLIMMAIVQNAFANTSSSLILSKIQGVIIDILMPPLKGYEITLAMIAGGVTRGLMVGITVMIATYMFVPFSLEHAGLAMLYAVLACLMMSLLGILAGVWSQSFDQLSAITNYIITPLAFLSGTFYSIKQLPEFWYKLCHFNPFFYMIDGFRYAFIGVSDAPIIVGITVLSVTNILLWTAIQTGITRGWRLKT